MRHFLANIATYTIGFFLIAGAAGFGWMRSSQLALTTEELVVARFEPAPAHEFEWEDLGAGAYERNCANCHRNDGSGWDQYPSLDHAAAIFLAPGGREYLIDVHLYGLTSRRWGAPMPPMGHMPDAEIAAAINHTIRSFGGETSRGGISLYLPAEIRSRRGLDLRPAEVDRRRPSLEVR